MMYEPNWNQYQPGETIRWFATDLYLFCLDYGETGINKYDLKYTNGFRSRVLGVDLEIYPLEPEK